MRYVTVFLLAACLFGADKELTEKDLIQPDQAVKQLKSALVIHVGFPVLYRSTHITGTSYAGPGSKEEGIADLKKAVAGQPHDRDIVLYCQFRVLAMQGNVEFELCGIDTRRLCAIIHHLR